MQELLGNRRRKFRAAICGEVVRDAKSDEDGPDEASGTVGRTFDDGPSRKAVDDNHIGVALVVKVELWNGHVKRVGGVGGKDA